jgi:RiboL-PSP-HEPN
MNNSDVDLLLTQCRSELTHVQGSINTLGVTSPISPYLTKYAVIRACGTVEVSFKALIADFCTRRSKKQVKRYIALKITRSSANPSHNKIVEMLAQFDEDWKDLFKSNLNADPGKAQLLVSLQSLVDARNDFAHGGNPTLSINDVIMHFDHARKVLEHVDLVVV